MSPHFTTSMDDDVSQRTNGSDAVVAPSTNGFRNPLPPKSRYLRPTDASEVHDLVCIGFGPASMSVAIALHDSMEAGTITEQPKVLFLEKQADFAWHAGMLLPGAHMQISFIKDLASLRDPRSNFTFLNYLHKNNRLIDFTNLDTFLPARAEFEDYLRWCARHFDDVVRYQNDVVAVTPIQEDGPLKTFEVTSRNTQTGEISTYLARNVLLAVGGQPNIPAVMPAKHPRVIHSSQYAYMAPKILNDLSRPYRVAVIGAGQSAAEIFSNVQNTYLNSKTYMIMRSEFLKPSDDSPFVNQIFNPEFIDQLYPKSSAYRKHFLNDAKATNYSVVRLELIEQLYHKMYHQKRTLGPDETQWPHRIMGGRKIVDVNEKGDQLQLRLAQHIPGEENQEEAPLVNEELLNVDLIVCATGYQRRAHLDILKGAYPLLPQLEGAGAVKPPVTKDRWLVESEDEQATRVLEVGRDYGVRFAPGSVANGSGIWLQGCNEGTHGLSDTLLSVLAVRSGEIVQSVFGTSKASRL